MEDLEILSLEALAGGAVQEKIQVVTKEVLENMQDPNTPWKNKREVVIKLSFTQNEDRDDAGCEISVSKKLAQVKPIKTSFSIGQDLRDGKVFMSEYGPQIKGQLTLSDMQAEQIVGTDVVDTDTGEIIGNVVDLRSVREA